MIPRSHTNLFQITASNKNTLHDRGRLWLLSNTLNAKYNDPFKIGLAYGVDTSGEVAIVKRNYNGRHTEYKFIS